jgi:succinyl-CoA synthetase alpha subunit
MTILLDQDTRVVVQGITGRIGSIQARLMLQSGTRIVAGVTPGKGGETVEGIPVYDAVDEAISSHPADASIIFVPAIAAMDAAFEAIRAGMKMLVIITEHIPIHDALKIKAFADQEGVIVIGPNTPGVISPGKAKLGIMPANLFRPGNVGMISRSGTLAYEIAGNLSMAGIGQSTCVGIGGDEVTGVTFVDMLKLFYDDPGTDVIVMVGEIGRTVEEEAAKYVMKDAKKPAVAYVAGESAPPMKTMGHAGAIIEHGRGSAKTKIKLLQDAGVNVIDRPTQVSEAVKSVLRQV